MLLVILLLVLCSQFMQGYSLFCPVGYYEKGCSAQCGHCAGNGSCSETTGFCFQGCVAGYSGLDCQNSCPSNCGGNGSCSISTRFCSEACKPGYIGFFCNETTFSTVGYAECLNCVLPCKSDECVNGCLAGFYGQSCSSRCDCSAGAPCQQTTGTCITPQETSTLTLPFQLNNTVGSLTTFQYIQNDSLPSVGELSTVYVAMIVIIAVLVVIILIMVAGGFCYRRRNKQNSSSYEGPIIATGDTGLPYTRPCQTTQQNSYLELEASNTFAQVTRNETDIPYYSTIDELPDYLPMDSRGPYLNDTE